MPTIKSFGPLVIPPDIQAKNWTVRRKAILAFCRLVNPHDQAFHPHFLAEEVESYSGKEKFFDFRSGVEQLIARSSMSSLKKHVEIGSKGPLPNKIHFVTRRGLFILKWRSLSGVEYQLFIYRRDTPYLLIKGTNIPLVSLKIFQAGLPKPESTRVDFMPGKPLPNLADIEIPLGDLVEFLKKYQR